MKQDTKVNGMAIMQHTPHGWTVRNFYSNPEIVKLRQRIEVVRGHLILCGDFVMKPKCGFAKRPHKLLSL